MGIVIAWTLAVELVGLASLPLAVTVFARLPDRGWALAKPLGLLILGWLVWFPLITIQALPYSAAWIAAVFVVYAAANVALLLRVAAVRERLLDLVTRARGYIVLAELLFALAFAAFAWFRSFAPAVVDTEKFMDVAFISSLWRAPHLPAPDPWLSGYPINYYYFGHFLVATLAKSLGTQPGTAFNLGISLIFALTAVAVFGVALNLTAALRRATAGSLLRIAPYGLAAVFFVLIAGNLRGAQVWWQDALNAATYTLSLHGNPWAWWTNRTLWPGYEWWPPSRAIPNTITEFPAFSFVLSDLHAHVLALPFAALAVGLALNILLARGEGLRLFQQGRLGWLVLAVTAICLGGLYAINGWDLPTYLGLALLALAIQQWLAHGRRWSSTLALNTLAVGSLLCALCLLTYLPFYRGFVSPSQGIGPVGTSDRSLVGDEAAIFGLPVFILGTLLVLWLARWAGEAFADWYGGAAYQGSPSNALTWLDRNARLVGSAIFLWLLVILALFTLKSQANPAWTLFWCAALVIGSAAFVLRTLLTRRAADETSGPAEADDSKRAELWLLCLFGTAAALVAGCELLFVRDIFNSRMNTVFKLYYQAWLLLGIAAVPALAWLLGAARRAWASSLASPTQLPSIAVSASTHPEPASSLAFAGAVTDAIMRASALALLTSDGDPASDGTIPITRRPAAPAGRATGLGGRATSLLPRALRGLRPAGILLWGALLVALVGAACIYPVLAASARANNFTQSQQPGLSGTLDGTAYMADDSTSVPADCAVGGGSNRGDNYAIAWLNTHVSGSPVILEAPGCEWSHFSRISAFTGLPTLLGWPGGHEGEWRINWPPLQQADIFGERTSAINTIYTSADEQTVLALLRHYSVAYVYVGAAERNLYATADLDRFSSYLRIVYKYDGVTIYAVSLGAP
jgi:YYY domain-containing protein